MEYQTGFLNHFSTEAVAGALPVGRNSPQRPAFGALCGTVQQHRIHSASGRKPSDLVLPHATFSGTRKVYTLREATCVQECAVRRTRGRAKPAALGSLAHARRAGRLGRWTDDLLR